MLSVFFLLSFAFIDNISAQSNSIDDVRDPKRRTKLALETLQKWYNTNTGLWESTGWWNGANVMTMIGDFAKADVGDKTLHDLAINVFATTLLKAPIKNPQPGIEDPPSKSTTLGNLQLTGLETGYMKSLDPLTNALQITYPSGWHDNNALSTSLAVSSRHKSTDPSHPAEPDFHDWLDGFYDDDLWWALAWLNAYDVTSNPRYLVLAERIFIAVSRTWGTHCFNGGIYWSWQKQYVNAISNELFFSTAAHLAHRALYHKEKTVYLHMAEKSLHWFLRSGMINGDGTINDGLTDACGNNGKTVWSYNQGVILGGFAELYQASAEPNASYLALASNIAKAALVALSDENGVIHDKCEPNCGADGSQFKGIFMRNLAKLHRVAPDEVFASAIRKNAASIWKLDRNVTAKGLPVFSVNWAGPWISPANASTHSSAMEALVAAINVDLTF